RGNIVDIEREAKLGGALHSKGVMILAGFLMDRFAAKRPLNLSARLVFEQNYAPIDGDSASSTELYALLSALSDLPIDQGIAVTGSVNQHGKIQAIGGVNQKIEGFFDLCKARRLTGKQGVVIPKSNVKNLMLRKDVVQAVKRGRFHVWAVETVEEGIEILTGVAAGKPDQEGNYPKDSVYGRVVERLTRFSEALKSTSKPNNDKPNGK
ncbi:MAG: ATP-dependent protease, partial [Deltaproteobacteria bacterium]